MVNLKAENDFSKLKEFIVINAKTSIHKPSGMLKYNYVTPTCNVEAGSDDKAAVPLRSTLGHYLQMYDWDACFFSQAMTSIGINNLIEDVVANFLSLKQSDGYIPRTVSPNRVWDTGDMCKPFLAQTLWFGYEKYQFQTYFKYIHDLDCYLSYFDRTRLSKSGLYTWRNVLESGVDDNLALIYPIEASKDENKNVGIYPDNEILAIDLNCYLYGEFIALAQICKAANNHELMNKYNEKALTLKEQINKTLYDHKSKFYYNVYGNTFVPIKSWTNLLPVVYEIADKPIRNSIIENHLLSAKYFNQAAGLTSMSKDEVLYNQAKRGLYGRAIVSNWQGPVWILPNAIILRYLRNTHYQNEALVIAKKVLTTVWNNIKINGTMYENYNAHTGEALWAPQFMSWNSLCLELIDFVENN